MPLIERSALVEHSAADMYRLVNQVARYPEFLNWCTGTEVLEQAENAMVARVSVNIAGIRQAFTTRNALNEPTHINMQAVDGPFRRFEGQWSFRQLGDDGSRVGLQLDFELASDLLASAFSGGFSWVAKRLVTDFVQRANTVFGQA
ncbi:MAG: type II toxin-antitoxin system RatA family toxin [Pseudomonadota bacterium]